MSLAIDTSMNMIANPEFKRMAKLTLVDLVLVGSTFCPSGYGEVKFDTIKAAKAWAKAHGYRIDLALTQASDLQGGTIDVYTKRVNYSSLQKAYLERI